ncbi:MAG TPA: STAS domain-containing protein [Terriglobia bacterium]|nr:STAS domain-containing protein [Terriglobia bacterium]
MEGQFTVTEVARTNENGRILKLVGPLTITTMFDFRDTFRAETSAQSVILDMTDVPYVDSAGMGSIVNAHVSCANHGRRLALVGVADRIMTMLKVTRVDSVLAIYPTLDEALRAVSR